MVRVEVVNIEDKGRQYWARAIRMLHDGLHPFFKDV